MKAQIACLTSCRRCILGVLGSLGLQISLRRVCLELVPRFLSLQVPPLGLSSTPGLVFVYVFTPTLLVDLYRTGGDFHFEYDPLKVVIWCRILALKILVSLLFNYLHTLPTGSSLMRSQNLEGALHGMGCHLLRTRRLHTSPGPFLCASLRRTSRLTPGWKGLLMVQLLVGGRGLHPFEHLSPTSRSHA